MDEPERPSRRADSAAAAAGGQPEDELVERDREAQRQDVAADARDDQAQASDREATVRDRAAEERDRTAETRDHDALDGVNTPPAYSSARWQARQDREQAASDRAQAVDDRGRARRDRKTSKQERQRASHDRSAAWDAMIRFRLLLGDAEANADDMFHIGQAQGLIMQTRGLGPDEALAEIFVRAARDMTSLGSASTSIVTDNTRRLEGLIG